MKEVWKNIKNYKGLYQVSNLGRIKSLKRNIPFTNRWGQRITHLQKERILKAKKQFNGYLALSLSKDGEHKTYLVHRLVAEAFILKTDNKSQVDHINGDKTDNRVENLRWVTPKENCLNPLWVEKSKNVSEETRNKLSDKAKYSHNKSVVQYTLDEKIVKEWVSIREIERQLGFKSSHICNCLKGRHKTAYGYIWKYKKAG